MSVAYGHTVPSPTSPSAAVVAARIRVTVPNARSSSQERTNDIDVPRFRCEHGRGCVALREWAIHFRARR